MGRAVDRIDDATAAWIQRQRLFFVGTAPTSDGRVNVSPKGLDSLRVLSPTEVAYLDLTGSGAETIAHLRDNGRITFMFCAFSGPPRIVRLYGQGVAIRPDDDAYGELAALFPERRAVRSIVRVVIDRVQDACGYAVPEMEFVADRTKLDRWASNRTDAEIADYWRDKNAVSIDGLPALED